MANVIGRGYNGGVSNYGAVNTMGSDQVHVTPPDQNGVQHTIVYNGSGNGSSDYSRQAAAAFAGLSGTSTSEWADMIRAYNEIRSGNSAESQARAEQQMQYQTESDRFAMAWSANEAAKNREWQERLANTSHQREVEDLLKAGLNPILSAGGNGAVTPSGSTGQSHSSSGAAGQVDFSNPMDFMSMLFPSILSSATQLALIDKEADIASRNNASNEAQARMYSGATAYAADQGFNSAALQAAQSDKNSQREWTTKHLITRLEQEGANRRNTETNINQRSMNTQTTETRKDTSAIGAATKYIYPIVDKFLDADEKFSAKMQKDHEQYVKKNTPSTYKNGGSGKSF